MKTIIICADDFGLSDGVCEAILALADLGRVSAVSCMVEGSCFKKYAQSLRDLHDKVDIGLHLTFTDQNTALNLPLLAPNGSFLPFLKLAKACFFKKQITNEVVLSIFHQFTVFQNTFGFPPDFIDGHQHVQNLPVLREAICNFVTKMPESGKPYLRITSERSIVIAKRNVALLKNLQLSLFGSALAVLVNHSKILSNIGFSGAYDFSQRQPYNQLFSRFLIDACDGSLLMCHPGTVDAELIARDTFTFMRDVEYEFFQSSEYLDVLVQNGIKVDRFRHSKAAKLA